MKTWFGIVLAGAGLGFVGAAGIYFDPAEPYKHFLSKGGWVSGDAPYVVATLIITGVILAPIIRAFRR